MRKAHWAENRTSWEGIYPPVCEMECFQGKTVPTIIIVYWFWQARNVAYTPNTTMRQLCQPKCSHTFLRFTPTICCSLFSCSTQITGLFGLSHTRQTWMRWFFSVNKSYPSEVEFSEYFPQLISRSLTIHTCPSCSENKKHSVEHNGKWELWLRSNSQDIRVWLPNPPTKHDQSCQFGPV